MSESVGRFWEVAGRFSLLVFWAQSTTRDYIRAECEFQTDGAMKLRNIRLQIIVFKIIGKLIKCLINFATRICEYKS